MVDFRFPIVAAISARERCFKEGEHEEMEEVVVLAVVGVANWRCWPWLEVFNVADRISSTAECMRQSSAVLAIVARELWTSALVAEDDEGAAVVEVDLPMLVARSSSSSYGRLRGCLVGEWSAVLAHREPPPPPPPTLDPV